MDLILKVENCRGKHENSIKALEKGRITALETRRKNAELKRIKKELEEFEKSKSMLNLELEISRMRERQKENRRLEKIMRQEEDKQKAPLSKRQLESVIKNVFC